MRMQQAKIAAELGNDAYGLRSLRAAGNVGDEVAPLAFPSTEPPRNPGEFDMRAHLARRV